MENSIRNFGRSMRMFVAEIAVTFLLSALLNPILAQNTIQPPYVKSTFTGDYRSGGTGAYTLTVTTNNGALIVNDIFVHDLLPPGFMATFIRGDGWECNTDLVLCFHQGGFASGSDPITLGVHLPETANLPPLSANSASIDLALGNNHSNAGKHCFDMVVGSAERGYNVLYYSAYKGATGWLQPTFLSEGRKSRTQPMQTIPVELGPFLPTVLTNSNRIMVIACGLKFDTVLNVSQAVVNLPENAADIRGVTPTPPPTPLTAGPSVDALQAAGSSTASAIAATVPSNSTPTGIVSNALVTLGGATPSSGSLTYNPVSVKATPADFANAIRAYEAEAAATRDVMGTICKDPGNTCKGFPIPAASSVIDSANGTVWNVDVRAQVLREKTSQFYGAPYSYANQATFDEAVAEAGRFAVILAALDSKITFAAFNTRIATLASTYSALSGDLLTLQQIQDADNKAKSAGLACPNDLVKTGSTGIDSEYCYVKAFLDQLKASGICLASGGISIVQTSKTCDSKGGDAPNPVVTPTDLYDEMNALRSGLQQINQTTSEAFALLNRWYDESYVIFTDSLTPSASNADLRIAVSANETFVPFVLNAPSSSAAGNPPPSTTAAAPAGHFDSSTIIRVERVVHFNLVGGVMITHVPNANYSYIQSSVIPPSGATSYSPCLGFAAIPPPTGSASAFCPVQTASTQYQVAGMAGVNWIPWGRNYYPRGTEPPHYMHKQLNKFGILLASSVTSLGSGFGGGSFEPTNGFDFFAGVASAHSQTLPSGTAPVTASSAPSTVPTVSTLHFGFSFGVGFDLGVFKSLFSSTSTPAIP